MRSVAVIIDGVWHPQGIDDAQQQPTINASNNSNVVNLSEVDQIVALLSQVVRLAQPLSESDQRRARDFMQAAQAMLTATTYLPKSDQRMFEASLREVVARNG